MTPTLSICMPTYNRGHLIGRAFASVLRLVELGVAVEVVIGDNASTDDTPAVLARLAERHGFVRVFRNPTNVGALVNCQMCLRRARGEFAFYLADDDTLLADEVHALVALLQARPDIAMAALPYEMWDDGEGRVTGTSRKPGASFLIEGGDFARALDLCLDQNFLPEIFLMRRAVIDDIVAGQADAYYSFVNLASALRHGGVLVHHRPAYRFHSTCQGSMETSGWAVATGQFEEFRAGLELCLFQLDRRTPLTPEQRAGYGARIDRYIRARMLQAANDLALRQEHRKAMTLLRRLAVWITGGPELERLHQLSAFIAPLACAQEVHALARAGFGARFLALHHETMDPLFLNVATTVLSLGGLERLDINEAVRTGRQEETVVLAERPEHVPAIRAAGFPSPHVFVPARMVADTPGAQTR